MIRSALPPFAALAPLRRHAGVLLAGVALSLVAPHAAAWAQDDDAPASVSRAVVQPTAPSAGKALNAALERLARDPRNVDALLGAGDAALALGDNDAALGFFGRADQVAPANPTVKAAIAGARLHLDDPVEALRWYADAERAGGDPAGFALDRGLAFDLVGDNVAAIAQYRAAIARGTDPAIRDEATRREAISLAIGGDRRAADLALLPLLQRQDRAAWRAHIFVLAIAGRSDEAVSVARTTMPVDLAEAIAPYLRFMVRLTPAQQAAVASQGRFPRAAEIGRDDPRVVAYAAVHPRVPLAPAAQPAAARPAALAAADDKARHRRHGAAPAASAPTAVAAAEPELVLPAPPPPVGPGIASPGRAELALAPPPVPGVGRTVVPNTVVANTVAPSPVVPQPTVLSRLDMPPSQRRAVAPRAVLIAPPPPSTPVAPTLPIAPPPAQYQPQPTAVPPRDAQAFTAVSPPLPVAPPPAATVPPPVVAAPPAPAYVAQPTPGQTPIPGIMTVPVPASTATYSAPAPASPAPGTHVPMVEPTPRPAPTRLAEARPAPEKPHVAAKPKAALASETAEPEKVTAKTAAERKAALEKADRTKSDKAGKSAGEDARAAKAKAAKSARDDDSDDTRTAKESAKDKAAHKKAGRAAQDDDDAALGPCKPAPKKGRGKAAAHDTVSSRTKARHGAKGRKPAEDDSDTCVRSAKGDRPDGPGGVSRDSDDAPVTKAKKGKGKDKGGDSDEKPAKGKARYASRIWVQVLTGGDREKMAGEWRAMVRKAHALKGHKPSLTPWRSNFRLLTGPFDSDADAQDFIAELRKDGVSSYEWTSPAGQAVDSLPLP
jgi:tetratricopeptide (TPR) repeat protein